MQDVFGPMDKKIPRCATDVVSQSQWSLASRVNTSFMTLEFSRAHTVTTCWPGSVTNSNNKLVLKRTGKITVKVWKWIWCIGWPVYWRCIGDVMMRTWTDCTGVLSHRGSALAAARDKNVGQVPSDIYHAPDLSVPSLDLELEDG